MTATVTYSFEEHPDDHDYAVAEAGLFAHADEVGNPPHLVSVHVFARDEAGAVIGACGGEIMWGDLYIDLMWVAPDYRGHGIGAELLTRAEQEARLRRAFRVHLDTMTFQAPAFYPKLGYVEYARLGGYPGGIERIYFAKSLDT